MSKKHITRQHTFLDYEGFVEKFKPKKTTDDCEVAIELTPQEKLLQASLP